MKRALFSIAVVLIALMAAQGLAAQHRRGPAMLGGVVLGPDDKPVANANVTYQSAAGTAPHVVRTDAQGHFAIKKLKSDDIYDLRASGDGVFSEWEKNVSVRPGQTKWLTLRLIYAKEIPKAYTKSKAKQ
jgi:hypothetical protein